jgi:hypothetical protein
MLRFTYRTARGLWSEAEDREMSRADVLAFVPSELMRSAALGCDAPEDDLMLLRAVENALKVLWSDLRRTLKPAAELNEETPAGRVFKDAVNRIWKTMKTWEAPRDGDKTSPARRVSLAGVVQRDARGYLTGTQVPKGRLKWIQVRQDVGLWWRPVVLESGECTILLAMQYCAAEQVGIKVPEVDNEDSFGRLGRSYGVFADTCPVRDRLTDGTRLCVLASQVSANLLATVEDDPPGEPFTDT